MPRKRIKSAHKKAGLAPGSIVYVGEQTSATYEIKLIEYSPDSYAGTQTLSIEQLCSYTLNPNKRYWIDVAGISNTDIINKIGEKFVLHPLSLEDLVNTGHRPKVDDFDDYYFIILKALKFEEPTLTFQSEQISLVFGTNYLLSFHEKQLPVLAPVYQRLEHGRGRIRRMPIDYLAYALIDCIVDNYFIAFEKLDSRLELLQDDILKNPHGDSINLIHNLKRELQLVRHDLVPLREVLSHMVASDSELLHRETDPFFKDLNDHGIHAISELDSARDNLVELAQYSLILLSNKVAEVTKVLTLMASIFIPLTFIVGIYGMNFDYMPELRWKYGYFAVWGVMLALSGGLIYYFRRKRWF